MILTTTSTALGQDGHEYSPIQEASIEYKNWSLPSLDKTAPAVDLREWSKDKKLVLVVYFAPWCGNWKFEAPIAAKLYDKYKDQGFQVIGISEYAPRADVKSYFGETGPPFPVVIESEAREDKVKTPHYGYRQACEDTRNWGSPWNLFLEPSKVNKKGDVLTEKAWVVNGELIEEEVDKFIASKVQAPSTAKTDPN